MGLQGPFSSKPPEGGIGVEKLWYRGNQNTLYASIKS